MIATQPASETNLVTLYKVLAGRWNAGHRDPRGGIAKRLTVPAAIIAAFGPAAIKVRMGSRLDSCPASAVFPPTLVRACSNQLNSGHFSRDDELLHDEGTSGRWLLISGVTEISGRRCSGFDIDRQCERSVQLVPHLNGLLSRGHIHDCE